MQKIYTFSNDKGTTLLYSAHNINVQHQFLYFISTYNIMYHILPLK